jgi:hypothetical protein
MSVPEVHDKELRMIAARFFLLELREMMCEGQGEVKEGLPPVLEIQGRARAPSRLS